MVLATTLTASTTVGIPIAITGILRVFSLISFLLLPTPLPGVMPVLDSCIVLLTLSIERLASASITIKKSGFNIFTIPFI